MSFDRVRALLLLSGLCAGLAGSCLRLEPTLAPPDVPRPCNDGIDNDGDGLIDFPADPGCVGPLDPDETHPVVAPACSDGIDNDGDGRIDYDQNNNGIVDPVDDPGCDSAADDDESNLVLPECADGIDNDGDRLIDLLDPECTSRNDTSETM